MGARWRSSQSDLTLDGRHGLERVIFVVIMHMYQANLNATFEGADSNAMSNILEVICCCLFHLID